MSHSARNSGFLARHNSSRHHRPRGRSLCRPFVPAPSARSARSVASSRGGSRSGTPRGVLRWRRDGLLATGITRSREPGTQPEQRSPGGCRLRFLRLAHKIESPPGLARHDSPPSRLAQPPCFDRNRHQARKIRSASRTNPGAAKASLADRTAASRTRAPQFGRPPIWPSMKKSSSVSAR